MKQQPSWAGYGLGKLFEKKSVQDLYARILVAIPSAESISGRIQKLQPQMIELLKGGSWRRRGRSTNSSVDEHMIHKWDLVETLKRKLEKEREKHRKCIQAAQRTTFSGFQTGFGMVFEALAEFSKAVHIMQ
ncbi:hypothetical protein SAY87_022973 [Trapa incisa]|uniref:Uncharacterized protein n=1 Tax=Trapa incisa TaxID=236973 RepID=A0AAN7Q5C4_9MYRT|nr:hypothetical protein SAY87_022973 [Trapa incisa]